MKRLAALLPFLLVPELAHAGELNDVLATVISYSKWVFILIGMALILRIAIRASQGQPTGPALRLAAGMTLAPGLILAVLGQAGRTGFSAGPVAAGGRSYVEFMLAQAGLLSSSLLASWTTYNLILVAVVFGAAGATAIRAHGQATEDQAIQTWKGWIFPTVLIFAVFNPFIAVDAPRTAGGVIYELTGQHSAKPGATKLAPMGGSIQGLGSGSGLAKISQQPDIKLIQPRQNSSLRAPLILSKINSAMDQLVGSIVDLFGRRGFAEFGMVNARSSIARLNLKTGNADLDNRVQYFIRNCYLNAVMARQNLDPTFAQNWAKSPDKIDASLLNPFSPENLGYYKNDCKKMVAGHYNFGYPQGSQGGIRVVKGQAYPHPLGDEVLGNLAFRDANLRRQYKWSSVSQAIANVSVLKNAVWNRPSSNFYFQKMSDALVADIFAGQIAAMSQQPTLGASGTTGQIQAQRDAHLNPVFKFLKTMGMGGFQLVSTAKGAAETELVNLEMPIWMGSLQMILLALFPIIFLLALLPGMASTMGYFLLTLLWSKSYVIAWALISNLDAWQSQISGTTAENLAMSHTIQQLQIYSPFVMALVIFGPKVAAYSLSRGGGGA